MQCAERRLAEREGRAFRLSGRPYGMVILSERT